MRTSCFHAAVVLPILAIHVIAVADEGALTFRVVPVIQQEAFPFDHSNGTGASLNADGNVAWTAAGGPGRWIDANDDDVADPGETIDLPGDPARVHDIGPGGVCVGSVSENFVWSAVRWSAGGAAQMLTAEDAVTTFARGINENGDIIGHARFDYGGGIVFQSPVQWPAGGGELCYECDLTLSFLNIGHDIANDGTVVSLRDLFHPGCCGPDTGMIVLDETGWLPVDVSFHGMHDVAIDPSGDFVVGTYRASSSDPWFASRWTRVSGIYAHQQLGAPTEFIEPRVFAVNELGDAVGDALHAPSDQRYGIVWLGTGQVVVIDDQLADDTWHVARACDINADRSIAAYAYDEGGVQHVVRLDLVEAAMWIAEEGGDFEDPKNWSDGVVPEEEPVGFDIGGGIYSILISETRTLAQICVGADDVEFQGLGAPELVLEDAPDSTLLIIAPEVDDIGTLRIYGTELTANGISVVARGGIGTLAIVGGGSASLPATGEVGQLLVGLDAGDGRLEVEDGGILDTGQEAIFALDRDSTASINVSGLDALWSGQIIRLGQEGYAELSVSGEARVEFLELIAGAERFGDGHITVSDDAWLVGNDTGAAFARIGVEGTGTCTVTSGGRLDLNGCCLLILGESGASCGKGSWCPGEGTLSVSDAGHVSTPGLQVGVEGLGTVHVGDGGTVDVTVGAEFGLVAESVGALDVSGGRFEQHDDISDVVVGGSGAGAVDVTVGEMIVAGNLVMAQQAGSGATMVVDTGTLQVGGAWSIGERGDASSTVSKSSTVNVYDLDVGFEGSAALHIESGSNLTAQNLRVGNGDATVLLTNVASALIAGETRLGLAHAPSGSGVELEVSNSASLQTHDLRVGIGDATPATLRIATGGSVQAHAFASGALAVIDTSGGTFQVGSSPPGPTPALAADVADLGAGSTLTAGAVEVTDGILRGAAVISTPLLTINGTVAPGSTCESGTLAVSGDVLFTSSARMECAVGTDGAGAVSTPATVTLGGTLSLAHRVGDAADVGAEFDIILAGTIAGGFDSISMPDGAFDVIVGTDRVTVRVTGAPPDGDATGDGHVDVADLLAVLAAWGPCADTTCAATCPEDVAGADGVVDVGDLLAVLARWGA